MNRLPWLLIDTINGSSHAMRNELEQVSCKLKKRDLY
jgi:hypothetical protein